jgi:hypothetical protein
MKLSAFMEKTRFVVPSEEEDTEETPYKHLI